MVAEPTAPSTPVATEAPASAPASPPAEAAPQEPEISLFDRFFRRGRAAEPARSASETATAAPAEPNAPTTETPKDAAPKPGGSTQRDPLDSLAAKPLSELSKEELKALVSAHPHFQSAVQGEVDRREARRQLRRDDPYAAAEQEDQQELAQQHQALFAESVGLFSQHFDDGVISPVLELLPDDQRAAVLALEGAGAGIAGRALLMKEAVSRLVAAARVEGREEAEQSLRTNPAFRQQVLSEFRRTDEYPEPESVLAADGTTNPPNMNDFIRTSLGRRASSTPSRADRLTDSLVRTGRDFPAPARGAA